jgi:hypothetical protein
MPVDQVMFDIFHGLSVSARLTKYASHREEEDESCSISRSSPRPFMTMDEG